MANKIKNICKNSRSSKILKRTRLSKKRAGFFNFKLTDKTSTPVVTIPPVFSDKMTTITDIIKNYYEEIYSNFFELLALLNVENNLIIINKCNILYFKLNLLIKNIICLNLAPDEYNKIGDIINKISMLIRVLANRLSVYIRCFPASDEEKLQLLLLINGEISDNCEFNIKLNKIINETLYKILYDTKEQDIIAF